MVLAKYFYMQIDIFLDVINVMEILENRNVLFLDDEIYITKLAKRIFSNKFNIFTSNDFQECLDILSTHDIALIISDYKMKEINGVEVLKSVKTNFPNVRRILLSGNLDLTIVLSSINDSQAHKVLQKPWDNDIIENEIVNQLMIFNNKQMDRYEIDKLKEISENKTPIPTEQDELLELLLSLSEIDRNSEDFSEKLILALNGLISLTNLNAQIYFSNETEQSYKSMIRYLSDIEIIANQFDQKLLNMYIFILRAYIFCIANDFEEARRMYAGATVLFDWFKSYDIESLLTDPIVNFPIHNLSGVNEVNTENGIKEINYLLNLPIEKLIKINTNLFTIKEVDSIIQFLIITRDEKPLFSKQSRVIKKNIEPNLISGFVSAINHFLTEVVEGTGNIQKITHETGVIIFYTIDNFNFILLIKEDTIRHRISLRQFSHSVIDLLKTIPKFYLPEESELAFVNKILIDNFGEF